VREFMRLQFAEQYHPRIEQAARRGRIFVGNIVLADFRAARSQDALGVVDILERERDAVQRSAIFAACDLSFGRARVLAREIERGRDECA
jgi:hypothetical protein